MEQRPPPISSRTYSGDGGATVVRPSVSPHVAVLSAVFSSEAHVSQCLSTSCGGVRQLLCVRVSGFSICFLSWRWVEVMFARNIGGDVSVTKVTMDGSLMICYGFDESFVVLVSWWC
ncbi:hypothetical protein MTR_4g066160 [Medicago truncatula]|uniref:Uncharacterized protein n=1 Tax=Medicago truncatula TaxID=3880 RepID=A0A072UKN0_MEDTR|nr:hypothetical protein MTR_4g066160 [Medicago truncatula]